MILYSLSTFLIDSFSLNVLNINLEFRHDGDDLFDLSPGHQMFVWNHKCPFIQGVKCLILIIDFVRSKFLFLNLFFLTFIYFFFSTRFKIQWYGKGFKNKTNTFLKKWFHTFIFCHFYLNLKKYLKIDFNSQIIWYFSLWFIFTLYNFISLIPKIQSFNSLIIIPFYFSFWIFSINNFKSILIFSENFVVHFLPARLSKILSPIVIFIELLSYIVRPVSLSIRLFANILAGHILVHVISGYCSIFLNNKFFSCFIITLLLLTILNLLEYFIAFIQSSVFVLLSVITQSDNLSF